MKYQFEEVNCALCNSNDFDRITDEGQFGLETHVVICKKCSLCYLNPRWDNASYLHFYKHQYDLYYRAKENQLEMVQEQIAIPILDRLKRLNLLPKEPVNILDIGSGRGEILRYVCTQFPQTKLFAIEPSLESQKELRNYGIEVLSGDMNSDWNTTNQKFDFIIMRHVLEHFGNPLEVLKNIRELLTDNGVCYIAVPNNLNPSPKLRSYWFRAVHTYYFNRFSLESFFKLAGLSVLNCTEGDSYNQRELFAVVSKGKTEKPVFDERNYVIQMNVLSKLLKRENNPVLKTIFFLKKLVREYSLFGR